MDEEIRRKILALLDQHRIMTIATLRPDGWPQATTVGYANEGLTLYFLCGPDSQKAANLARDDRVSLTIDHDTPQVMEITGLSMAARAQVVVDPTEAEKALRLLMLKYPQQASIPLPMPTPADVTHISRDPDGDLRARLLQGLRTHRSCHLLGAFPAAQESQESSGQLRLTPRDSSDGYATLLSRAPGTRSRISNNAMPATIATANSHGLLPPLARDTSAGPGQ